MTTTLWLTNSTALFIASLYKLSVSAEKLQRYREERLKKAMQEVEKSEKQNWNKEEVLKLLREVYEG